MFDNWVNAHEFEWIVGGILLAITFAGLGIWALCVWIAAIFRERRKQREDGIR